MKRLIAILLPLIILGAFIIWRLEAKRGEAAAMAQQRQARANATPQVCVEAATQRDILSTFEATGTLESPLNVKISPKITGRLEYLSVHEGDRVSRGQVLARLDGSQIEAEVRRQQAAVAEANYRLAQSQISQGPTTVSVATQIKQQSASLATAKADLTQVQKNSQSQIAAAEANVADIEARIAAADATIANAKAGISRVQASLSNASTRLSRLQGLLKQGYVAAQEVDDAKAEVAVQQASLEAAQGQLQSAQAARESVVAQKRSAEQQVSIAQAKAEADVEAARQKVKQTEAGVELARANTAQNPAYVQGLAALRASVAAAKAELASARAQRAETVLTCPLDGYVTSRLADPGSMATAGQPLLVVQFFKQVWVSIAVPDTVSAKMRVGQPLTVSFDALPDKPYTATVVQINPSADPQARQFTVRAALDNPTGDLRPGMFAKVSIVTEKAVGAVSVPREAVQRDEGGEFVNVVEAEGAAHRRPITTGLASETHVAVTSGLQPGEQVITMCAVPLKEGQKVKTGAAEGGERGKGGDRGAGEGAAAPAGAMTAPAAPSPSPAH